MTTNTQINPSEIRVLRGPPGSHGFRSGTWVCEYRGTEFKVFSSVPHSCEFDVQDEIVRASAARYLAQTAAS
jgi:hypothetical protein